MSNPFTPFKRTPNPQRVPGNLRDLPQEERQRLMAKADIVDFIRISRVEVESCADEEAIGMTVRAKLLASADKILAEIRLRGWFKS